MPTFRLIVHTTGREEYVVEADSYSEAVDIFESGTVDPLVSEVLDAAIVNYEED